MWWALVLACGERSPGAAECGDGVVQATEACDDGSANADDGRCTSACETAACGDGLVRAGVEGCDDGGGNADGAACTSSCEVATCGDGLVREGAEACDEGAANADDGACTASCEVATCGDGLVHDGVEGCDEGAANADDGACTTGCEPAACGDGLVQTGVEACDLGDDNGIGECNPACELPTCGDGFTWVGREACDDSNLEGGDGCGPTCELPVTLGFDAAAAKVVGRPGDRLGTTLAAAGDVNGDGHDDLLVGLGFDNGVWGSRGGAYVVYGPVSGEIPLPDQADAILVGEAAWDQAGSSLAGAGDVNGDGFDDLLIGAFTRNVAGAEEGTVYLVHGPVQGVASLGTAAARIVGVSAHEQLGISVAGAGDVNGDGFDDVLLGAVRRGDGYTWNGGAYLFHGPLAGVLRSDRADVVFTPDGEGDFAAYALAGGGDLDADGYDDLVIGAPSDDHGADDGGAAYVFNGPVAPGERRLAEADAILFSGMPGDWVGERVSLGGDVNGDGFADVLLATHAPFGDRGAALVVFGPVSGPLDLGGADVRLRGEVPGDGVTAVDAADLNGDGFDDLLVGAQSHAGGRGATYVAFGPLAGDHTLAQADVKIVGLSEGDVAALVCAAGDLDGDGLEDLAVGAPGARGERGEVYVVPGETP